MEAPLPPAVWLLRSCTTPKSPPRPRLTPENRGPRRRTPGTPLPERTTPPIVYPTPPCSPPRPYSSGPSTLADRLALLGWPTDAVSDQTPMPSGEALIAGVEECAEALQAFSDGTDVRTAAGALADMVELSV